MGDSQREIRIECLRPGQLNDEHKRCPLVFVPIGPLEYHSPHLPVGMASPPTLAMKATELPKIFMAVPKLETDPPVEKVIAPNYTRIPGCRSSAMLLVSLSVSKRVIRSRHRCPATITSY